MRLKAVGAEILAALTLACPVLAFSEPIGSDDVVIDADDTIAADTPDSDSNDTAWLSASPSLPSTPGIRTCWLVQPPIT